ncbi:MAG: hypoxanthine phosphoribosyltransferase [Nitrospira sp.]|nr:hypoxanthine phosphoribosyltransferase [Nitrospira sp.]MCP9461849.1 hypoxanthine phosphoribosyltransferase [Nitrospira sp.]
MERLFGKPIVTQEQMRTRIRELGRQISADYTGKDLVLIGVLKGAYAFYADLARAIRIPIRVDFLVVTTEKTKGGAPGKAKLISDLTETITGKDVLLVEDIVDSGLTAQRLLTTLAKKKPRSINICALLSKQEGRVVDVHVAYIGFTVPNRYIVGYGLDYQQKYRNLPYLAVLDEKDLTKKRE